jgi:hypothetical protein
MDVNNEETKHMFVRANDDLASSVSNSAPDHPNCSDVRITSVGFLSSTETESQIDGHTINIPHKRVESEVSTFRDSFGLAAS